MNGHGGGGELNGTTPIIANPYAEPLKSIEIQKKIEVSKNVGQEDYTKADIRGLKFRTFPHSISINFL